MRKLILYSDELVNLAILADMNPISDTAYYCCGVRMQDAAGKHPVCGDNYARTFMNAHGLRILEKFASDKNPNASNVARHRIIDDILREALQLDPALCVVIVGAGFDSRAWRLTGGFWVELDEPQVIAYKEECLPAAGCPNSLQRIAIDFAHESLTEKLAPLAQRGPALVVMEGVFMYLEQDQITTTLRALRAALPGHVLLCDLMSRKFFERYSCEVHRKMTGLGASFRISADDPEAAFLANGYRRVERISIVAKAVQFGTIKIPRWLLFTFLRTLAGGYAIYRFASSQ